MSKTITIELKPTGYFIARAEVLGIADGDIDLLAAGKLPRDRRAAIEQVMNIASQHMMFTVPQGNC